MLSGVVFKDRHSHYQLSGSQCWWERMGPNTQKEVQREPVHYSTIKHSAQHKTIAINNSSIFSKFKSLWSHSVLLSKIFMHIAHMHIYALRLNCRTENCMIWGKPKCGWLETLVFCFVNLEDQHPLPELLTVSFIGLSCIFQGEHVPVLITSCHVLNLLICTSPMTHYSSFESVYVVHQSVVPLK